MGYFDKLRSIIPKQFQDSIPDNFEDVKALGQEYAPQLQSAGSGALDYAKGLFSSNDGGMVRGEPPATAPSSPGMLDSIKGYFKDDPNSGWYDKLAARNKAEALHNAQGDYENAQNAEAAAYYQQGTNGQAPPSRLESAYKSALGGLGSAAKGVGNALTSDTFGALAPALGGVAGYAMAAGDRKAAQNYYNQSLNSAGTQVSVGPSASENLQDSQQDLANRAMATQQVAQRAEMGFTPEDKAMFQQARQQADESYQANQSKINTDMSRRGMSMSPAMIAAQQQQAAQDTARRQADDANKVTQASFQAKQAAAQSLGTMSNNNLQNDFNRGLAKANNQDSISQFNANQQRARANSLTGAQQAAGNHSSNQAVNTANAMTGIGAGVGTAVGTLNANKKVIPKVI